MSLDPAATLPDPADPHDLRPTAEAAIETAKLAVEGFSDEDSVQKAIAILKKIDGVQEAHGEAATGMITVTFDARKTHVPDLHDALLHDGYTPRAHGDQLKIFLFRRSLGVR